jgi:hypothetical protein
MADKTFEDRVIEYAPAGGGSPRYTIETHFPTVTGRYDGSGSGTSAVSTNGLSIQTTGTAARLRQLNMALGSVSYNIFDKNPSFTALCHVAQAPTTADSFFGLGYVDVNATTGHNFTNRPYMGFKIVYAGSTGTLSATNGDGSAETATVIAGITLTSNNTYYCLKSATDINFYVNGVLVATHTTNLPATAPLIGAAMQWSVSNKNTATNLELVFPSSIYSQDL